MAEQQGSQPAGPPGDGKMEARPLPPTDSPPPPKPPKPGQEGSLPPKPGREPGPLPPKLSQEPGPLPPKPGQEPGPLPPTLPPKPGQEPGPLPPKPGQEPGPLPPKPGQEPGPLPPKPGQEPGPRVKEPSHGEMETTFMSDLKAVVPIQNGLQLTLQQQPNKVLKAFTYAPTPQTEGIKPVRNKVIVTEEVQGDHVIVHKLEPGDKLAELVSQYRSNILVKAVVVVNTGDSYILKPGYLKGIEKSNFPLIVVTANDGQQLLEILDQSDDVLCDIDVESTVDVLVSTSQPQSESQRTKKNSTGGQDKGKKFWPFGSGDRTMKAELKKLVFPVSDSEPVAICEDGAKFSMAMSIFQNYERQGKPDSGQVRDTLQKLTKHLPGIFIKDFPFYMVLAYRMYIKQRLYQCDDYNTYMMTCITSMENARAHAVCTTLSNFIRRGDFSVMFGDGNSSVFQLMELAFIEMCKISYNSNMRLMKQPSGELYKRFIYNTMVWVSLALRVRVKRGVITRSTASLWTQYLTNMSHQLSMNEQQIDELKFGLEFGKAIELPPEVFFSTTQICDMLISKNSVRYFSHLKYFFHVLHSYIPTTEAFLTLLTQLRSVYDGILKQSGLHKRVYERVSKKATLASTLEEGHGFLNRVVEVWIHRNVRDTDLKTQFESECKKWLILLLQLIDVTAPQAHIHLKEFIRGKGLTKKYRKDLERMVIANTRSNFSNMTIQQFYPLYSAFRIWPPSFLEDYLKQYKVPKEVKLVDGTWNQFFTAVTGRFSGAHAHYFMNEFLQSIAIKYQEDRRARDFVVDLVKIRVPRLLAIEPGEEKAGSEVQTSFKQFLQSYIRRNALKHTLLTHISHIMDSITEEKDEFQGLVLTVVQKEVVPEFKTLQGEEALSSSTLKDILTKSVTKLCKKLDWLTSLTPKQCFCWGIVATCCTKIPIKADSFSWIHDYEFLIHRLCHIYKAYCNGKAIRGEEDKVLKDELPVSVTFHDDIKTYFEWVRQVQRVVLTWQRNVTERELNYDGIMLYAVYQKGVEDIGHAISATSTLIEPQAISEQKNTFLEYFEQLNMMLLRYIPGKPEVKWCTLTSLLAENGVTFPTHLDEAIAQYVLFPSQPKEIVGGVLESEVPRNTTGQFNAGNEISLKLSKKLNLKALISLVDDLQLFLQPILDRMDMLVFFRLHHSVMFNMYQKLFLDKLTNKRSERVNPASSMSSFTFSVPKFPAVSMRMAEAEAELQEGMKLSVLVRSLDQTKELLIKLIEGNATYNEIIAEGKLDLENLDIDQEFNILEDFILHLKHTLKSKAGLTGVRNMLELFQYTKHIQTIDSVCEQYKLQGCLGDENLKQLWEIAEELAPEKSRRALTLNNATETMKRVKALLFEGQHPKSHCLQLFAAVADSAAFYQFIKDKRFTGDHGKAVFSQQYQLITAQLQHEEYDEHVLNHLFAAFNLMSPFMNTHQNFRSLMGQVIGLDTSNGLKQLETVNSNITMIQLWFSRAEGDTLQNVAKELESIITSGLYIFTLSSGASGGEAQIMLEYMPSTQPALPPAANVEDGTPRTLPYSGSFPESGPPFNGARRRENWNAEQINDFVRKLGFLDAQREGGNQIKHFLHINEVANKLLNLHIHLKDLGHPKYLEPTVTCHLECKVSSHQADGEVEDMEGKLTSWTSAVTKLRSRYEWLLFFSVPKLLLLYQLIREWDEENTDECLDLVVKEVMFLVSNDSMTRNTIKEQIERCIPQWHAIIEKYNVMEIVGGFLGDLLQNHTPPRRSTKAIRRPSSVTQFAPTSDANQFLHHAPKYSQSQLVRLIVRIYGGVPESFEMFHCRSSSTEEELSLFLERIERKPLRYLILDVDKLPFRLQEYLMQRYLKIQQKARKKQAERELVQSGEHDTPMQPEGQEGQPRAKSVFPTIHFVETAPSVLRELPWILLREHKEDGPSLSFADAQNICKETVKNFAHIQIVYGKAGDGKTHYIKEQLQLSTHSLTIAVNEAFTPLNAIKRLRQLQPSQRDCAIFLNFTMLPPGGSVDKSEDFNYKELMKVVGWFFFNLLLLGCVEDPITGLSFSIPGGMDWRIYVEVPSRISTQKPEKALSQFMEEVPALGLLGVPHPIDTNTPYKVNDDVQLVCKYLKAYWLFIEKKGQKGINKLFRESTAKPVKFSTDADIPPDECQMLLKRSWPDFDNNPKVTQKLFIKYMKRRCAFLDQLPAFNYNTGYGEYYVDETGKKMASDTRELGSTLMSTMLQEVSDFCDPSIKDNWSLKAHQQLIYDFRDGGGSFGLLSLHPEQLPDKEKMKFKKIRVNIPSMIDLYSRDVLDDFLARALNIELENKRLVLVDKSRYVLTLDYTIKMLNIHERYECGVPVIIEGETGVGKTALVEMLSKLWNQSLLCQWKRQKDRILDFMRRKLGDLTADESSDEYMKCVKSVGDMSSGKSVKEDDLISLCQLPDATSDTRRFYTTLRTHLLKMQYDPVLSLLTLKVKNGEKKCLDDLFADCRDVNTAETTASLLHAVMSAEIKSTFYKINVHAALTPEQIWGFFKPAVLQADALKEAYEGGAGTRSSLRVPFVTVFLDEVNTSSCLGLFKEIILDRTFDGEPIPHNVFIVAACNPHRGNSLAAHRNSIKPAPSPKESWIRSSYYVRKLHPTLDFLKWDYGSLGEHQERDYINAKMKMLNKEMASVDVASLTELIVVSQNLMREYARQQLTQTMSPDEARIRSRSCVSQRDIQRVFTFFLWFRELYAQFKPQGERNDYSRRAILVSLGIVYYMRLNTKYREEFIAFLNKEHHLPGEVIFSVAFKEELQWFINNVELPTGIARTQALMENLFATIVCTGTHTPLIIVGAPGSSKTLSFNLVIANLKGQESKVKLFRNTPIFHSLDPHFYQCSRRTTSNEIDTVFSRAINRQRSHTRFSLPIYCVVFMDEAGLPEESHESLKVLHYHLDHQEVSFVAITNHMLDAAKNNRAVCLFRPEASEDDLKTLARGCLSSKLEAPPPELRNDLNLVVKFCAPFSYLMRNENFSHFFGLRDFIHFVNYLRRRRGEMLNAQVVMEALERNFNGYDEFEKVAKSFLETMGSAYDRVQKRSILTVLKDSLQDRPSQDGQDMSENEVRYKLIIDPSEDDSLIRLLFSLGVLDRQNTRMYVCSDFPGDSHIQKINTIAAIRHSAIEGHTVVMSQTDDIHESFYDLFNQRFRRIDDPQQGPRYYTNIAIGAHLRPCRVHPTFQCVVVVKKSEVKDTPAPFLNRFEKYCITHSTLLETALAPLPPCLQRVILAAKDKVEEFVFHISQDGLYGMQLDTINSLILSLLPPVDFQFQCSKERGLVDVAEDIRVYTLRLLIQCLRRCCGLHIPYFSPEELESDAKHVFSIILLDAEFEGLMGELTHHRATDAVYEALMTIQRAPEPVADAERIEFLELSAEGCLVVLLLQQWFVRQLIKRMMQLMTSEAFTEHRTKIPSSYLENYLAYQAHFSLSRLINKYYSGLANKWEPNFPTSKVLCFTRSSPLIHQLPAQYPSQAFERQGKDDVKQTLKDLVHQDVEKLMVCKLSNVPSQSRVMDLLRTFVHSDIAEVLLLVVNMQEIKQQVINHIRIMIEEEEAHLLKEGKNQKLFLLLLHFPPSKFSNACYPSLFLRGWDHYYLDTIAHSAVKGVIDIRSWFWDCCFPQEALPPPEEDPLVIALKEILNEAIPILSSRVFFGFIHDGRFNTSMSGSQRSKILKALLFEKGMGDVLCEKFRSYWKPNVMSEYLRKAVAFTQSQDSTLNITDSIQTMFKALFFDFLVYMITRINEDCNIDVLFSPNSSPAIQELFLKIVRVFPIPKLSQLKIRSVHLQVGKQTNYVPQFPFFKMVSEAVERLVEDSHEEANKDINLMGDLERNGVEMSITYHGITNQQSFQVKLKEIVVQKVKKIVESEEQSFLAYSLKAKEEHPEIWDCYFSDFIAHTLHLDCSGAYEGISQRILRAFFSQLYQEKTALERVVQLHVYINVYHLELAKMATVLRPLNRIQHMAKSAPNALSPLVASPTRQLVDVVQKTQHPLGTPEHLSAFVIGHLFNALVGVSYGRAKSPSSEELVTSPDKLLMWYKAYRDVMCLPALKQHVYSALKPGATNAMETVEARLNVMQTVFLTLQTLHEPTTDLLGSAQQIFQTLFNRHFAEDMELKTKCPRLESMTEVSVEVITQTCFSPSLHKDNNQVRLLMEGLFAHFFSSHRPAYHKEDIEWFLELANQQEDWCVVDATQEVIGGTSDQDLLDELQKSIVEKERARTSTLSVEVPKGAISMCIFKLYLSRILGECDRSNEDISKSGPLILHQYQPRLQVGLALMNNRQLGGSGPYLPTFYQECPSITLEEGTLSERMQQPLAHLYFLAVLEHILSDDPNLANMVRAAGQLSHLCTSGVAEPHRQVLLHIEFQAVLQVMAKLLAELLDGSERLQIIEIQGVIEEINLLFSDPRTGGGSVAGHGMVVGLHLLRKLKSSRKFSELMTTKFEVVCKEIKCLRPLHDKLQQPPESTTHQFPFMLPVGGDSDLRALYQKVRNAMLSVHQQRVNVKELEKIATECNTARRMSGVADGTAAGILMNKHCNFKMMMWLVIYYEFYDKGVSSINLTNLIGGEEFPQLAKLEEGEIRLFQCFLDTQLMTERPENPNPLRGDEIVLELAPGGGHRRRQPRGRTDTVDPLHQLFVPKDPKQTDQSDVDLRYALANMIAVVLGCRPQSNHLWYHLFDQQSLWGSYLTGFMYNNKINKDGLLYDCGVELSPEGQFGRQDYLKHANRGTYTLHSLYLLLWANFGSFCMALLTQPDADRAIHGPIISDWLSVRHYCVSQLRTVWLHMRNNLGVSDEERSFLLMRCMKRLYEFLNNDSSHPESHRGVFTTPAQLDSYEKLWHLCVYKPSRSELAEKFTQYSDLMQHDVFVDIRSLEQHYPYFPSEKDFTHSVLSSGDITRDNFSLLSRFALQWPRLQAGGELLPDLVELYQWLHTFLAHVVSYDMACKVKIKTVIERAVRRYSPDMGEHLRQLFERVKVGYNKYVELIGGAIGVGACAAVRRGNKIYTVDDNIPLLHFLSDVEEEEEGNDWLFTVIADIITAHNDMVELPKQVASQPFSRLLPDEQAKAYPQEITTANCIIPQFKRVHGVNELLQLLRSRHKGTLHSHPTSTSTTPLRSLKFTMSLSSASAAPTPLFHLQELQEDMVTSFLAGKPLILDVSSLRTPFRFKVTAPKTTLHPADAISTDELTAIMEKLPGELKAEVDNTFRKRLEFEFHTAGYHVMLETTTGLRTAAGHLVKAAMNEGAVNEQQTLSHFLLSLYDGLQSAKQVFNEIGIRKISPTQITCLSELPLSSLYFCLKMFAAWMEEGMYDFSTLPYTIKAHLSQQDRDTLKAIPQNWDATLSELLEDVRSMNELLSHTESHITQEAGQTPITNYLRGLNMISDEDRLPRYIPDTVLIQHYVEFRVVLRRIMSVVQHKVDQEAEEKEAAEGEPQQWKEVVEDIWSERLPHFRGELYLGEGDFLFDPDTGHYGFQYEYESDGEDDLMGGEEEGEREDDGEFVEVPEEEQAASVMPSFVSTREDELSNLMRNPDMKERVISYAKALKEESLSMAQHAAVYTPELVAEFLRSVGLGQYTESFIENDISGEMLLEAEDDDWTELGVNSHLHRVKISVLFKRLLLGATASQSVEDIVDFLKSQKLDAYIQTFRDNGIDGDILAAIVARKEKVKVGEKEVTVVDLILQEEFGMKTAMHRLRVKGKIKGFCDSLSIRSSSSSAVVASSKSSRK